MALLVRVLVYAVVLLQQTILRETGSHDANTGACRPFKAILVLFTVIEFRTPRVALKP
jgi:hypothetical protein